MSESKNNCIAISCFFGMGIAISNRKHDTTVNNARIELNVANTVKSSGVYKRVNMGKANKPINWEKAVPPTNTPTFLIIGIFRSLAKYCLFNI